VVRNAQKKRKKSEIGPVSRGGVKRNTRCRSNVATKTWGKEKGKGAYQPYLGRQKRIGKVTLTSWGGGGRGESEKKERGSAKRVGKSWEKSKTYGPLKKEKERS